MRVHRFASLTVVLLAASACSAETPAASTSLAPDASVALPGASEPAPPAASEDPGEPLELPADLPVDVPDGGRLDDVIPPTAGTLQDAWIVRILYAPETADALVEFYDAWFADQNMEVQKTRNDRVARWADLTDHPLQWVTVNFADRFYGGNNRVEIWYSADE